MERTMMEIPTTPEFRDHVRRQMMSEAKRQLDRVNGVAGAGSSLGGKGPHRPTARRGGGTAAELEMAISEGHVTRAWPRLIVIEGGKR